MIAQNYAQYILNNLLLTNADYNKLPIEAEAEKYRHFNIAAETEPENLIDCFRDYSAESLLEDLKMAMWEQYNNQGKTQDRPLAPTTQLDLMFDLQDKLQTVLTALDYNYADIKTRVQNTQPKFHEIINSNITSNMQSDWSMTFYYRDKSQIDEPVRQYELRINGYDLEAYSGWKMTQKSQTSSSVLSYPLASYLGLFITDEGMPDENGENYLEPSRENTTYQRVNLLQDFVLQSQCLAAAQLDESTGATYVVNEKQIIFPEIENVEWGKIVGFGIFSEAQGSTPILWGRLQNPISGNLNRVPLFRINNFKITLSDNEM